MFAALTGAGLSAASGLNAYIPFLIVALLARFTGVPTFGWVSSGWTIAICVVLLVTETIVDKIPALDNVNDALGTVVRPASGDGAAANLDNSPLMTQHAWVGLIGGALVAGVFHTGKAATRSGANIGTGGIAASVLSVTEDVTAVLLSLAAVFVPVLALLLLIVLAWVLWRAWKRVQRLRQRQARPEPGVV